jgi:hypothetical protein
MFMRQIFAILTLTMLLLSVVAFAVAAPPPGTGKKATGRPSQAKKSLIPSFKDLDQLVRKYFAAKEDFETNDLISQSDVEPLFKQIPKKGFPLTDLAKILADVPDDNEFLVQELSTPDGRKFMRQISRYDDGYDRVDRLIRLPRGKATLDSLVTGPDGYKMIQYMTTTSGGKALGNQLSNASKGSEFNEPTGRIYTMPMLLTRLQYSYDAAVKAEAKKAAAGKK